MSTSDNRPPVPHDEHVHDDLPGMVSGELDLDRTRRVTQHLRVCDACRSELVEVTAGIGLLRRLDAGSVDDGDSRTSTPARRPRRASVAWLSAAAVLVLVGTAITATYFATRSDDEPRTVVALAPVEDASASGSVAMSNAGTTQAMMVDTSLGLAPPAHYYEVWLLDSGSGKVLPVGVLPPDGTGTFRLPSEILEQYDTVDISLQADDGTTAHSSDSLLRADYA